MTVDEERIAETLQRHLDQLAERAVIGAIETLDARQRVGKAQLAAIDVLPRGDDPRDRAEADLDARRAAVDEVGDGLLEHCGIEFVGLAIDVEIGACEAGAQQRRAERRAGGEELVDETILRTPQRMRVEPGRSDEIGRIGRAAMRRGENDGKALLRRRHDLDRLVGRGIARGGCFHHASLRATGEAVTTRISWAAKQKPSATFRRPAVKMS